MLKTVRLVLAIILILSTFGIALVNWLIPGEGWKVTALGVLYGFANIVIFVCKDGE